MRYIILGAGPAGLTVANMLKQMGEDSFIVLEKEKEAGGLCRSVNVDGSPFDVGGGHFLDVKRKNVNNFLFEFLPENEWNLFVRDSRININNLEISHQIEANIWQKKVEDQVEYLKSISVAGCNQEKPIPDEFVEWIYWKLGNKIAENYMIPYNKKMFGDDLNKLGTYWLEKLPNVSFEETLLSCLCHKAYGTQPGHAQFYYPKKYGYGELWKRMAKKIKGNILYNSEVTEIDFDAKSVMLANGRAYKGDIIVTTIPWVDIKRFKGMPQTFIEDIYNLKYSSIETRYYEETLNTKAQWIYYPDPKVAYHRILVRNNFCANSKGYWTETNSQRISQISEAEKEQFSYMNKYAYPLNTIEKPQIMKRLLSWAETKEVYGLGRWGEWEHYNSDVTVDLALKLVIKLAGNK